MTFIVIGIEAHRPADSRRQGVGAWAVREALRMEVHARDGGQAIGFIKEALGPATSRPLIFAAWRGELAAVAAA